MQWVQHVQEIAHLYDTYVVDVWGVLYNGHRVYPAALEALSTLRSQGHHVVLLSNSARSSQELQEDFGPKGLHPDCYDRFVTSGDYVQKVLQDFVDQWGGRCAFIGTVPHQNMLQGLPIQQVEHPEEADFAVFASLPSAWQELHIRPFEPLLDRMYQKGLPAVCANPDLYGMRGTQKILCAGSLAAYYETLGGKVTYSGKPQPDIYKYALEDVAHLNPQRVLCIGDSLKTDIQGAQNMAYDALWVLGGVHQEVVLTAPDQDTRNTALLDLCRQTACSPPYGTLLFA